MDNNTQQSSNYHQGLLHFAHLLMTVDGVIDAREKKELEAICHEENIPDVQFALFQEAIAKKSEMQVYQDGIEFFDRCTEQERLCAMVHLFQLAESDDTIHRKEMRLLLYSLKKTNVDFEDIELTARMVKSNKGK
jgi:uncharacterized tellurite resistance protein B-like protein